jgi:hypothetical protein
MNVMIKGPTTRAPMSATKLDHVQDLFVPREWGLPEVMRIARRRAALRGCRQQIRRADYPYNSLLVIQDVR